MPRTIDSFLDGEKTEWVGTEESFTFNPEGEVDSHVVTRYTGVISEIAKLCEENDGKSN